jgi:tRNA-2-methylthio-N6-dimethylallyladenosine synthase
VDGLIAGVSAILEGPASAICFTVSLLANSQSSNGFFADCESANAETTVRYTMPTTELPVIDHLKPPASVGLDQAASLAETDALPGQKVYIETYGCQMNIADTELIGGVLASAGYVPTQRPRDADVILVNTCAVREHAEERVRNRMVELASFRKKRPGLVIGVTGCMAEHLKERLLDESADLVVGPDGYRGLADLIDGARVEPVMEVRLDRQENYTGLSPLRDDMGVTGWVTIMRGCDKFCSFCIVPFTRGREKSVPPGELLGQITDLADRGGKEVCLLGQTVNAYRHEGTTFADLLADVASVDGIERVRFTSPYPTDFTDEAMEVMATHEAVMPHLHLPVQSGSDTVLERMRREYTVEEFLSVVDRLQQRIPDLAMTTDVIAGFCGETDDDFQKTLDLMRLVGFDAAFMFKYSTRDGTSAYSELPDDIPETVKGERLKTVIDLQEDISAERFESKVGNDVDVLVAGPSKRRDDQVHGRTSDFKNMVLPTTSKTHKNAIVRARVTHATAHTLFGHSLDG